MATSAKGTESLVQITAAGSTGAVCRIGHGDRIPRLPNATLGSSTTISVLLGRYEFNGWIERGEYGMRGAHKGKSLFRKVGAQGGGYFKNLFLRRKFFKLHFLTEVGLYIESLCP